MQVNVHSIQFKADSKLLTFIETKLDKLEHYHDKLIAAEVFLKIDKNKEAGNKITEIKLNIPGRDLFARKQTASFEESTDLVVDALKRQISRSKRKKAMVN